MTTTIITAHDPDGLPASNLDNTDYVIPGGIVVGAMTGTSIRLTGSHHDVFVQGMVAGGSFDTAIALGDAGTDSSNTLHVFEGGAVSGYGGVRFSGSGSLTNNGDIQASYLGVEFGSLSANTVARVSNFGLISGELVGVQVGGDAGSVAKLTNHGILEGGNYAYYGGAGADQIVNRGDILGHVVLEGGNDLYDGRGGRVEGYVSGGEGNDTFRPGADAETFSGDSGTDTLDFRSGGGVRLSLVLGNSTGSGRAEGDVYQDIERVLGSETGADILIGDGGANTFEGFGGADTFYGGAGDDILAGWGGNDIMKGGAGNDGFEFLSPLLERDVIIDFGNQSGNNDHLRINVAGFGGGLVGGGTLSGAQFQARADYLAQDSNDRFIFRTTDTTLWFDSNGTGSGGLTLIADLQVGAVLTSSDILLI